MRANVSLLVVLGLFGTGCTKVTTSHAEAAYHVDDNAVTLKRESPVKLETTPCALGPSLSLPSMPARVTTIEALTSPAFAPLSGRVSEVKVRLGDQVEKGQKLVLVRTADLPSLELGVRAAELDVATRAASVERIKALVDSRAGSENELLLAQSELEQAKLVSKTAKSRLASLSVSRADDNAYWVLAQRKGTIVQLDAVPGLQVGPDHGLPLATVADLGEVFVIGDVPQRDAAQLTAGERAHVTLASDTVEGAVEAVSDVVDPLRQTVPVRVRVANGERKLRPNAFVDLSFDPENTRPSLLLPAAAVVRDGGSAVVFVETQKGTYERRKVVVGREGREQVEILSGVNAGDVVVKSGALLLLNAIDTKV